MRVYCTLTLLLFSGAQLWGAVYAGECAAVNSGLDISGGQNDISNQLGTTLAQCCDMCNANPGCKAFVWVEADGNCFLKSVDQPRQKYIGLVSGLRGPATSTPDQCLSVNSDIDITGGANDITNRPNRTLSECCALCNGNAACKAYVWVKQDGNCFLKSVDGPTATNTAVISGKKGPVSTQCSTTSGIDISPGSHDIFIQNGMTLAGCCDYCKSQPACKAFVWLTTNGQCFLKDVDQPTAVNNDVVSGIRPVEKCPTTAGVDISGGSHDIFSGSNYTLAACCDYCSSTPACKAFVWVKDTKQCFLKDVQTPTATNPAVISGISPSAQTPVCNAEGVKCAGYGDGTCCQGLSCGRSSLSEFACSKPPACANAGNGFFCNKNPKQPQNCCSGRCYGYECDQSNDGERCFEDKDCTAYTSKTRICVNRLCVTVSPVCSQNGAPCNPAVPGNNDQGSCCFTNCRPNDADPSTGVCTNDPACTRTEGAPCGSRYDAPCCTNLNLFCLPPTAAAVAAGQDYYTCQKSTRTDCAVRTQACGQDGGNIQCCGDLRCEKPTSFEPTIYRCHEPPRQPICHSLGVKVDGGFYCCSEHADTQTGVCPFGQDCNTSSQYCQCPQRQYTSCQNDGDCCGPKCVDYRCT